MPSIPTALSLSSSWKHSIRDSWLNKCIKHSNSFLESCFDSQAILFSFVFVAEWLCCPMRRFSLLRLIITQDPSLHRHYWLHRYYDPSDFLTAFSTSSLLYLSVNTPFGELLGSPTFTLLPLIACRALRPRRDYPIPSLIGLGWYCLLVIMTPSASHFHMLFGAQSHASAYGLQSPLSTLNSSRYLLVSKTQYGWMVSLSRSAISADC